MTEELERKIIELIAADRIDIPISSLSGKLKRMKPKLAKQIDLTNYGNNFKGKRVYARISEYETEKAKGMREGIEEFSRLYPRYGAILNGIIEEKRVEREINMCFGVNEGCRLTSEDYIEVMKNLGFSEAGAKNLYPELIDVSRKISRKRDEERSILIG
ncbi:MAG: hypothetical protein QXI33_02190 [Candidatus Pacearchaeota archaeon]